ncbi:unnamed protein product [Coccothraustes coccothraustes]
MAAGTARAAPPFNADRPSGHQEGPAPGTAARDGGPAPGRWRHGCGPSAAPVVLNALPPPPAPRCPPRTRRTDPSQKPRDGERRPLRSGGARTTARASWLKAAERAHVEKPRRSLPGPGAALPGGARATGAPKAARAQRRLASPPGRGRRARARPPRARAWCQFSQFRRQAEGARRGVRGSRATRPLLPARPRSPVVTVREARAASRFLSHADRVSASWGQHVIKPPKISSRSLDCPPLQASLRLPVSGHSREPVLLRLGFCSLFYRKLQGG